VSNSSNRSPRILSKKVKPRTELQKAGQIKAEALSLISFANSSAPVERRATNRSGLEVVWRSLNDTRGLSFALRREVALNELTLFLAAAHGDLTLAAKSRHRDLFSVSHPFSTAEGVYTLTASAVNNCRIAWVAADPAFSDDVRPLVASLLSDGSSDAERVYARTGLTAAGFMSVLAPLIAAIGDGNSTFARSMRARRQRRDRKGRFAWMGGGMRALVKRADGSFSSLSGRSVGFDTNSSTFDMELPNGRIVRFDAAKGEALKAVISKPNTDGFSAPFTPDSTDMGDVINESDLVDIEAPAGWNAFTADEQTLDGGRTFKAFQSESGDFEVGRFTNTDGSREFVLNRVNADGTTNRVATVDSWAGVVDGVRAATPKSERRAVKARLDEEFGAPLAGEDLDDLMNPLDEAGSAPSTPTPSGKPNAVPEEIFGKRFQRVGNLLDFYDKNPDFVRNFLDDLILYRRDQYRATAAPDDFRYRTNTPIMFNDLDANTIAEHFGVSPEVVAGTFYDIIEKSRGDVAVDDTLKSMSRIVPGEPVLTLGGRIDDSTPTPTPATPTTPAAPTTPPPSEGGSVNGELSPDGKWKWYDGLDATMIMVDGKMVPKNPRRIPHWYPADGEPGSLPSDFGFDNIVDSSTEAAPSTTEAPAPVTERAGFDFGAIAATLPSDEDFSEITGQISRELARAGLSDAFVSRNVDDPSVVDIKTNDGKKVSLKFDEDEGWNLTTNRPSTIARSDDPSSDEIKFASVPRTSTAITRAIREMKDFKDSGETPTLPSTRARAAEARVERTRRNPRFKVPEGMHKLNLRNHTFEPLTSDDPSVIARNASGEDIAAALQDALYGDGTAEIDLGDGGELSTVSAESLYLALEEQDYDAKKTAQNIYDGASEENEEVVSGEDVEYADIADAFDESQVPAGEDEDAELVDEISEDTLPALLDGLTEDELQQILDTDDFRPFLPANEDIELPEGYFQLDLAPFGMDEVVNVAEGDRNNRNGFPIGWTNDPYDIAVSFTDSEDLARAWVDSLRPGAEDPGFTNLEFTDDNGDSFVVAVDSRAVRDALQLQGVDTNEILRGLSSEGENSDLTDDDIASMLEGEGIGDDDEVEGDAPEEVVSARTRRAVDRVVWASNPVRGSEVVRENVTASNGENFDVVMRFEDRPEGHPLHDSRFLPAHFEIGIVDKATNKVFTVSSADSLEVARERFADAVKDLEKSSSRFLRRGRTDTYIPNPERSLFNETDITERPFAIPSLEADEINPAGPVSPVVSVDTPADGISVSEDEVRSERSRRYAELQRNNASLDDVEAAMLPGGLLDPSRIYEELLASKMLNSAEDSGSTDTLVPAVEPVTSEDAAPDVLPEGVSRTTVRPRGIQEGDITADGFVVLETATDPDTGNVIARGYYQGGRLQDRVFGAGSDVDVLRGISEDMRPERGSLPAINPPSAEEFGDSEGFLAAVSNWRNRVADAFNNWRTRPRVATEQFNPETDAHIATVYGADLKAGDISIDPAKGHFVITEVRQHPTKADRVQVFGYYPGHQMQQEDQPKEWKKSTVFSMYRNVEAPAMGDLPPFHQPHLIGSRGGWRPNPDDVEGNIAYRENLAAAAARFTTPSDVPQVNLLPQNATGGVDGDAGEISVPTYPFLRNPDPVARGVLADLMREANGDPARLSELLKDKELIFWDFETTGLDPVDNRVWQIGAVKVRNGEIVERFNVFLNPEQSVNDVVASAPWLNLRDADGNPISDEWLQTQGSAADAFQQFSDFIGENGLLIAQNTRFDREFLENTASRLGLDINPAGYMDNQAFARALHAALPQDEENIPHGQKRYRGELQFNADGSPKMVPSNSLGDLARFYGIDITHHDAASDSEATSSVLFKILDRMAETGLGLEVMDVDASLSAFDANEPNVQSILQNYRAKKAEALAALAVRNAMNGQSVDVDALVREASAGAPSVSTSSADVPDLERVLTSIFSDIFSNRLMRLATREWAEDSANTRAVPERSMRVSDVQVGDFRYSRDGSRLFQVTGVRQIQDGDSDATWVGNDGTSRSNVGKISFQLDDTETGERINSTPLFPNNFVNDSWRTPIDRDSLAVVDNDGEPAGDSSLDREVEPGSSENYEEHSSLEIGDFGTFDVRTTYSRENNGFTLSGTVSIFDRDGMLLLDEDFEADNVSDMARQQDEIRRNFIESFTGAMREASVVPSEPASSDATPESEVQEVSEIDASTPEGSDELRSALSENDLTSEVDAENDEALLDAEAGIIEANTPILGEIILNGGVVIEAESVRTPEGREFLVSAILRPRVGSQSEIIEVVVVDPQNPKVSFTTFPVSSMDAARVVHAEVTAGIANGSIRIDNDPNTGRNIDTISQGDRSPMTTSSLLPNSPPERMRVLGGDDFRKWQQDNNIYADGVNQARLGDRVVHSTDIFNRRGEGAIVGWKNVATGNGLYEGYAIVAFSDGSYALWATRMMFLNNRRAGVEQFGNYTPPSEVSTRPNLDPTRTQRFALTNTYVVEKRNGKGFILPQPSRFMSSTRRQQEAFEARKARIDRYRTAMGLPVSDNVVIGRYDEEIGYAVNRRTGRGRFTGRGVGPEFGSPTEQRQLWLRAMGRDEQVEREVEQANERRAEAGLAPAPLWVRRGDRLMRTIPGEAAPVVARRRRSATGETAPVEPETRPTPAAPAPTPTPTPVASTVPNSVGFETYSDINGNSFEVHVIQDGRNWSVAVKRVSDGAIVFGSSTFDDGTRLTRDDAYRSFLDFSDNTGTDTGEYLAEQLTGQVLPPIATPNAPASTPAPSTAEAPPIRPTSFNTDARAVDGTYLSVQYSNEQGTVGTPVRVNLKIIDPVTGEVLHEGAYVSTSRRQLPGTLAQDSANRWLRNNGWVAANRRPFTPSSTQVITLSDGSSVRVALQLDNQLNSEGRRGIRYQITTSDGIRVIHNARIYVDNSEDYSAAVAGAARQWMQNNGSFDIFGLPPESTVPSAAADVEVPSTVSGANFSSEDGLNGFAAKVREIFSATRSTGITGLNNASRITYTTGVDSRGNNFVDVNYPHSGGVNIHRVRFMQDKNDNNKFTYALQRHPVGDPNGTLDYLGGIQSRPVDMSNDDFIKQAGNNLNSSARGNLGEPTIRMNDMNIDGVTDMRSLAEMMAREFNASDTTLSVAWNETDNTATMRFTGEGESYGKAIKFSQDGNNFVVDRDGEVTGTYGSLQEAVRFGLGKYAKDLGLSDNIPNHFLNTQVGRDATRAGFANALRSVLGFNPDNIREENGAKVVASLNDNNLNSTYEINIKPLFPNNPSSPYNVVITSTRKSDGHTASHMNEDFSSLQDAMERISTEVPATMRRKREISPEQAAQLIAAQVALQDTPTPRPRKSAAMRIFDKAMDLIDPAGQRAYSGIPPKTVKTGGFTPVEYPALHNDGTPVTQLSLAQAGWRDGVKAAEVAHAAQHRTSSKRMLELAQEYTNIRALNPRNGTDTRTEEQKAREVEITAEFIKGVKEIFGDGLVINGFTVSVNYGGVPIVSGSGGLIISPSITVSNGVKSGNPSRSLGIDANGNATSVNNGGFSLGRQQGGNGFAGIWNPYVENYVVANNGSKITVYAASGSMNGALIWALDGFTFDSISEIFSRISSAKSRASRNNSRDGAQAISDVKTLEQKIKDSLGVTSMDAAKAATRNMSLADLPSDFPSAAEIAMIGWTPEKDITNESWLGQEIMLSNGWNGTKSLNPNSNSRQSKFAREAMKFDRDAIKNNLNMVTPSDWMREHFTNAQSYAGDQGYLGEFANELFDFFGVSGSETSIHRLSIQARHALDKHVNGLLASGSYRITETSEVDVQRNKDAAASLIDISKALTAARNTRYDYKTLSDRGQVLRSGINPESLVNYNSTEAVNLDLGTAGSGFTIQKTSGNTWKIIDTTTGEAHFIKKNGSAADSRSEVAANGIGRSLGISGLPVVSTLANDDLYTISSETGMNLNIAKVEDGETSSDNPYIRRLSNFPDIDPKTVNIESLVAMMALDALIDNQARYGSNVLLVRNRPIEGGDSGNLWNVIPVDHKNSPILRGEVTDPSQMSSPIDYFTKLVAENVSSDYAKSLIKSMGVVAFKAMMDAKIQQALADMRGGGYLDQAQLDMIEARANIMSDYSADKWQEILGN
jgi:DNA polymerase III epsilon subunit-like protein